MDRVDIGDWCTLYHADAIETVGTLAEHRPDAVIMDPPYSSGARTDSERQARGSMSRTLQDEDWFSHDTMTTWGFQWFLRQVLTRVRGILPRGAHVYIFCDWRQTPNVYAILESSGYRVNHCLVWRKTHFGMGAYWRNQHENIVFASLAQPSAMRRRDRGSVLECSNVSPAARLHPTEKPVDLLRTNIDAMPGETILDPFMGSGSLGPACYMEGRRFVGVEISRRWFDVAVERINRQTGDGPLFEQPAPEPLRIAI